MPGLADALRWMRAGRAIFPCYETDENGECACGEKNCPNAAKHPYGSAKKPGSVAYSDMRRGVKEATTNEEQIRIWWTRWPNANIGLATGTINKLVVFDFDGQVGLDNCKLLMNGTKPEDTLSFRTGGGGLQMAFKTDKPYRNRQHVLGEKSCVDIRGEGGYVIAPPSIHKSGKTYEFYSQVRAMSLPEYLATFLDSLDDDESEFAGNNPVGAEDWTRTVNDGEGRDAYLIRMAGMMARSKMPYKELATSLWSLNRTNVKPPKTKNDIIRIAKSACRMERNRLAKRNDFTPAEVIEEGAKEKEPARKGFLISSRAFEERFAGVNTGWLIDRWVPEAALGMLLAPYESHKTWMMVDLILTLSGARPFFLDNFAPVKTGVVLAFFLEDSFARIWERVAIILKVQPVRLNDKIIEIPLPPGYPRVLWHVERELNMKNKQSLVDLDRSIRKYNPIACAIDPMYPILDLKDYGMESGKELTVFKSMRDYYGLTFLIAHHMGKTDKASFRARDNAWGSVFLNAGMEFGIELTPQPQQGLVRVERHEKNSSRPPVIDVQFNFDPYNYHVNVAEEDPNDVAVKVEIIREILSTHLVRSHADLIKKSGIPGKQTIQNALNILGATKKDGFYVLPESERLGIVVKGK